MSGKVPPSSRAGRFRPARTEIDKAADLYERFSGHKPESVGKIRLTNPPKVGIVIGELDGVLYSTVRDNQAEKYIHKFSKRSRPLLVVSPDGKQLFIVGGDYDFTERGIVDRIV
jgi:hypothetical protein